MAGEKNGSPVDKGWAWMILLATVVNVALNSLIYTTGIFNVIFLELFDESRSVTAWCGALHSGLSNLLGVVASLMNGYWGSRRTIGFGALCIFLGFISTFFAKTFIHVFITYGIVVGFGFAFTIVPGYVILGFYFKKYRNIAFGIANASIGVGNAAFAPLLQYLLEEYGMNGTMLITGGISANMFVVAALCRTFQPSKDTSEGVNETDALHERDCHNNSVTDDKQGDDVNSPTLSKKLHISIVEKHLDRNSLVYLTPASSYQSLNFEKQSGDKKTGDTIEEILPSRNYSKLLSYPFVAWCINLLLIVNGLSCIYLHFPAYAVSMGTSPDKAALLVMVMGLGNMAIRLILGFLTNNSKIGTFIAYIVTGFIAAIFLFAGPYISTSFVGQVFFACFFAAFGNGYSGLMGPVAIDMFGLEIFNLTFGIGMTLCGVGFIIGPPIAGALYDYTGSYYYTFIMSGSCYVVANLLMVASPFFKSK